MADTTARASVDRGRTFWAGGSGKWAGEQLMRAMKSGGDFGPSALRTLDTLRSEEWKAFDSAVQEGAKTRLKVVADLIGAGLTIKLTNAMAKTILEYDLIGDMDPATTSMDGMARSENDEIEFTSAGLPIPIVHKDFFINLRKLMASRSKGEGLDVTQSRVSGRLVAEEIERMTILGGKSFAALPIYGLTTHPNRNLLSFGGAENWAAAGKTGDEVILDVFSLISALETDKFYGPYWIYYSRNASVKMQGDYKATGDKTIAQRVLEIDGVSKFTSLDTLPANNVIAFQATPDVVALVDGESPQTVQWDVNGGFGVNFKAFAIQIPLVRANADGTSGLVHMT